MRKKKIHGLLRRLMGEIAPEVDVDAIDPEGRFRDQFDFDSVDLLNLVKAMERELGIDVQAHDYSRLMTLNSCALFLEAAVAA